jgi:ABC-type multidrug transport system fused ATPase/permease subunit
MKSIIRQVLDLIDTKGKKRLMLFTATQMILNVLDLFGVAIIGIVLALSVTSIESRPPSSHVAEILRICQLGALNFRTQVTVLGLVAGVLLILKTVLAILFSRATLRELSAQATNVSDEKITKILSLPLAQLQKHTKQEYLYAVLTGVRILVIDFLSALIVFVTDFTLVIIVAFGLLLVDPMIALLSFLLFSALATVLYKSLHHRAAELGRVNTKSSVQTSEFISQSLDAYREIVVSNTQDFFIRKIKKSRDEMTRTTADMAFLPNVSKYIMEASVVLGTIVLGGLEFATKDAVHAASTLTIFMASASRLAPAILRIQQGLMSFKNSIGQGEQTFKLFDSLEQPRNDLGQIKHFESDFSEFIPSLVIENLTFSYESSGKLFENLNLSVEPGQFVAITGPSGSGKTTLVDLILGLQIPVSGRISISEIPSSQATKKWPGKIAYVPQDVVLHEGSIMDNVSFGHEIDLTTESRVLAALKKAKIDDFVQQLPNGINQNVGEIGNRLSGGQKQRLGIARALFTDPKFLVLDEATSSLDAETESGVSESLRHLDAEVTVITIAHRLSTVINADKVIYLSNGQIVEQGSFSEIRAKVPDFDKQASLMGLN